MMIRSQPQSTGIYVFVGNPYSFALHGMKYILVRKTVLVRAK